MTTEGDGTDRGGTPNWARGGGTGPSRPGPAWVWAATSALAVAVPLAAVTAARHRSIDGQRSLALAVLAVAGALCLAGWWAERSRDPGGRNGDERERSEAEVSEQRRAARDARRREEDFRREGQEAARKPRERDGDLSRGRFLRRQGRPSTN